METVFYCIKKFWPDCPLPIYLLTETKTSKLSIFTDVLAVNEKYTSDRIYKALKNIHQKYILVIPDDFSLMKISILKKLFLLYRQ